MCRSVHEILTINIAFVFYIIILNNKVFNVVFYFLIVKNKFKNTSQFSLIRSIINIFETAISLELEFMFVIYT